MPGAGRFRGGIGVVKAQRVLTDAFITHENERHHDVPWGIFGGTPGQVGRVDIYNFARPGEVKHMPAKFSGMRVAAGDVHVFYGPCGGGFGDPLERPAAKILEDVLDDFCTIEHARLAYGVIVDRVAETVDEAATRALRARMRTAMRGMPVAVTEPAGKTPATPAVHAKEQSRADVIRRLRATYGNAWSFEIMRHRALGDAIEVVGQLRANGSTIRETAVAAARQGGSRGELLERAANDSLRKCVETLTRNGQ
jgi:hypothetical protein